MPVGLLNDAQFKEACALWGVDTSATPLSGIGGLILERDAARAEIAEATRALRDLCRDHGDNNWPDDLHLADVIEKHLARHLEVVR